MKLFFVSIIMFISLQSFAPDCPGKIHWKKLKTEEQVKNILASCIPLRTPKAEIEFFLKENNTVFSADENGVIYASALTRSKSIWIEKKWLMEFVLDKDERLIEIRVKAGLTGP